MWNPFAKPFQNPFKKREEPELEWVAKRTYRVRNGNGKYLGPRFECRNAGEAVCWAAHETYQRHEGWTQEPFEMVWCEQTNQEIKIYTRYDAPKSLPARCFYEEPDEPFVDRNAEAKAAAEKSKLDSKALRGLGTDKKARPKPTSVPGPGVKRRRSKG